MRSTRSLVRFTLPDMDTCMEQELDLIYYLCLNLDDDSLKCCSSHYAWVHGYFLPVRKLTQGMNA